jgi:hypothetical protein
MLDHRADQVVQGAETEAGLVSADVAGRPGRVGIYEQFAGNIDEAQWGEDAKEQVPESGDLPGLRVEVMFRSSL